MIFRATEASQKATFYFSLKILFRNLVSSANLVQVQALGICQVTAGLYVQNLFPCSSKLMSFLEFSCIFEEIGTRIT